MRARGGALYGILEHEARAVSQRLHQAAIEIRRAAAGRSGGTCAHLDDSVCSKHANAEDHPLKVYSANAIACRAHAPATAARL